jgi:hypothetical protein
MPQVANELAMATIIMIATVHTILATALVEREIKSFSSFGTLISLPF